MLTGSLGYGYKLKRVMGFAGVVWLGVLDEVTGLWWVGHTIVHNLFF